MPRTLHSAHVHNDMVAETQRGAVGPTAKDAGGAVRRAVRGGIVALLPPLIAFACQMALAESTGSRWLLMTAAVIVSAAIGGMTTGLVATITSAALVWWFLIPPVGMLGAAATSHYLALAVFVAIGFAVSLIHERLRRTTDGLTRVARQNQIFAALIENSVDFIAIADPDGKLVYVNPAGRAMVQLPEDVDVERTTVDDYYPPDAREFTRGAIVAGMLAQGKWAGETAFRNWRTNARVPVLDTHFLIRDTATQRVIGIGTITRDVSAQKAQRDELEKTNRRLAATTRELGESQRFLQGILDYSPNGIVIKSRDGRYLIVNNGFRAMNHLELEGAAGKCDAELFPPALAQRLHSNDEHALAARQAVVTEEVMEQGGERRVFVVTTFPLFDDKSEIHALCSLWTDITQRKRDEEALGRVASDLRDAQRVAHVGSWRWDVATGKIEWSEELYHIFGLDPSKPLRKALFVDPDARILTEESQVRAHAAAKKTLADGSPYELELEFIRPDGTLGWIASRGEAVRDDTGHIIALSGTSADITKLKELQRLRDEWTSVIAHDLRQPIGAILMASGFLPELRGEGMTEKESVLVKRVHAAAVSLKRMVDDLLDMSLLEADRLTLEWKSTNPASLVSETLEHLAHLPGIERVRVSADANLASIRLDPMRIEQVLTNLVSNAIKYGEAQTDITIQVTAHEQEVEIAVTNQGRGIGPNELPRLFDRFMRAKAVRGSGVPGLGLGLYIAKGVVEAHGGRLWVESTPGKTTTFHVALPLSAEARQAA